MVRATRAALRRTDTFPSVFHLPVNRAKLSQRNAQSYIGHRAGMFDGA